MFTCVHPSALKTCNFGHDSARFRMPFSVILIHQDISHHSKSEQLELQDVKRTYVSFYIRNQQKLPDHFNTLIIDMMAGRNIDIL